jgi:hypothetical protein
VYIRAYDARIDGLTHTGAETRKHPLEILLRIEHGVGTPSIRLSCEHAGMVHGQSQSELSVIRQSHICKQTRS